MLTSQIPVEAFDAFVQLPENAEKLFEYIDGEIIELPSTPYSSYIAGRIFRRIANFVEENNLGYTTGESGGYMVAGERYAPDVAFISRIKQPRLVSVGYNPNPPDLAVEVDMPTTYTSQQNLFTKTVNTMAVGTIVWIMLPERKQVHVYVAGEAKRTLGVDDVLDGGDILPGFLLPVKDIFPAEETP